MDYWDIKQEKKIDDVHFGFLLQAVLQRPEQHVCVRGTPLPGDTLGPLQSINSSFINIGEQTTTGVDVSAYFTRHGHGRRAVRRAQLLAPAGLQEARN